MKIYPKIYIGPLSSSIIDTVIKFNYEVSPVGLIASRRQIEYCGGYVEGWSTKDYFKYVRGKSEKIFLCRDHAGPGQGNKNDDGVISIKDDCKYMNIIHIDPWKKANTLNEALIFTEKLINICYNHNKNVEYEIGTEEAIFKISPYELDYFIYSLKNIIKKDIFNKIKYVVVQSGTRIEGNKNVGVFNETSLKEFIFVCKKYGLMSKEHNGDYLDDFCIRKRFELGLDAINIAPEFGWLESKVIIKYIERLPDIYMSFFNICYNSKKWEKWVPDDFEIFSKDGELLINPSKLIEICGHYLFSDNFVKNIKCDFPDIDYEIRDVAYKRLMHLHQLAENF